ncbi:hypothetical protein [uncultured Jannaschia sp.]|uniref:hypothetical protein n=1 Tax=uncultured Jannaschia sp. TaxID=293347 RepID=UPI00261E3D07|nr:hypothetical protein [uncultured Jannaschia sp.]
MAEQAELDARIARIQAALGATARALKAAQDRASAQTTDGDAKGLQAELDAARARIAELEAGAPAADPAHAPGEADGVRLRAALEAMAATSADLRAQTDGAIDASLKAENDALRAARAMDLAEMQALLAELEPMLEAANA